MELMERECPKLAGSLGENVKIVFDTNIFKYRIENVKYKTAVSSGIFEELGRYPDVFPDEAVRDMGLLLNPYIIKEMISIEDELLIERAIARNPKAEYRKNSGIGWVDEQQIGYAMKRAREEKKTILFTNDRDILGTVYSLSEDLNYVRENVYCLSVHLHLKSKYADLLKGHEKFFAQALFKEIDSLYKHAA